MSVKICIKPCSAYNLSRGILRNNSMEEIIKLQNVSFGYGSNTAGGQPIPALRNISLSFYKGEFVALLGHNGSGKSTLAKLLNGLLTPSSGSVEVFGLSTAEEDNLFDIRKNVGVVFQNPDNQTVASIIEDDIAFGPENLGIPREEIIERVDWALRSVGMAGHKKGTPHNLSGGQKQRIAIAGILAIKPQVLVLDEATAMLDPKGRKEVIDVITKLNKEEHITVILITHFMAEAVNADRIIVLNEGEIYNSGTPAEIFRSDSGLEKIGLELPMPVRIRNELVKRGINLPEILTTEQLAEALCQL